MSLRDIFINKFGRLRSGWRVLLFIAAVIAAAWLIATLLRVAYAIVLLVAPQLRQSRYLADMLLIDGDPIADVRILQDKNRILAIMKDGKFHKAPRMNEQRRRLTA